MFKHILISGLLLSLLSACAAGPQSQPGTAATSPAKPAATAMPKAIPSLGGPENDPLMPEVKQADAAQDWPKLESLTRQLAQKYPDDWTIPFVLGTTLLREGKESEVSAVFDTALRLAAPHQSDKFARNSMSQMLTVQAILLEKQHRYKEAAQFLYKAVPLSDEPARIWFYACTADYVDHDDSTALVDCGHAIDLDPKMPEPWYVKGMVLTRDAPLDAYSMHVSPEARTALLTYLKLAPDGQQAAIAKQALSTLASSDAAPPATAH